MTVRGSGDPFELTPLALDEVRKITDFPMFAVAEGLSYLAKLGQITMPAVANVEGGSRWRKPLIAGLGFGTHLSVQLLRINAPQVDVNEHYFLWDPSLSQEEGRYAAANDIAHYARNTNTALEEAFDPNICQFIQENTMPKIQSPIPERQVFLGAAIYGNQVVREALRGWEIDNPVAAVERYNAAAGGE